MSLLSLPLEIIVHIAGYIDESIDFLALVSLNRCTYNLFISDLYKRDVANTDGWALGWYADNGMAKGVRAMLAAGAKVDVVHGCTTPLLLAIAENHTHIVKLLLENGASPNISADDRPFEVAIYQTKGDYFEILQLLLDYGANINFSSEGEGGYRESPLHIAARDCDIKLLKFLLDRGANVQFGTLPHEDALSVLHHVADALEYPDRIDKSQLGDVVRLLVDAGIDVNCMDTDGMSPLMVAASYGSADGVQAFLDCGADVNYRVYQRTFDDGWHSPTALHHAVEDTRGDLDEVIKVLIGHGADVNAVVHYGSTPLHIAQLDPGQLSTKLQILLDHGADLHAQDGDGLTILHCYADSMQCEPIKWACHNGLDVNVKNPQNGYTPLHYVQDGPLHMSMKNERIATTQLLLDLGADVNVADSEGATPLCFASAAADVESMRILLDHGANVNHRDITGLTPLHWVAGGFLVPMYSLGTEELPYSEVIGLLLERGAEINAQSLGGETPLSRSVHNQVTEAQACLIEAGGI